MSLRVVALLTGAALVLAGPATAGEKHKHKHKEVERTCVCTMGHGPAMAPMAPMAAIPAVPPVPPVPHMAFQMHKGHPGGPNVMVFRDDGDERVVIVRKHKRFRDSADENNDGQVSRREFMRRAEEHFKERDRDGDGKLDPDEAMSFEMPEPPEPPEAPEPPDPEDE